MGAGSGWWGVGEGVGVGVGDVGECGHAARRMLQPRAPILASASARSFIACPLWARTCLILTRTTSPRLRKRASTHTWLTAPVVFCRVMASAPTPTFGYAKQGKDASASNI